MRQGVAALKAGRSQTRVHRNDRFPALIPPRGAHATALFRINLKAWRASLGSVVPLILSTLPVHETRTGCLFLSSTPPRPSRGLGLTHTMPFPARLSSELANSAHQACDALATSKVHDRDTSRIPNRRRNLTLHALREGGGVQGVFG